MTRNLKALGLALLAAFAMSAVAASSASASEHPVFTSDGHEVELTAESIGGNQVFTAGESEVVCENVELDETTVGTEATEITAFPTYPNTVESSEECTALGFDATIDMNGCDYLFTAVGSVHIECPEGKQIEVTVDLFGATRKCIDIPAQTPTEPAVDYKNKGSETEMHVELEPTVAGITYTKTGFCGSKHGNDATYEGNVTVTGHEGGKQVDVTWDE